MISAQEFRLVDHKGALRAILDVSEDRLPYLQFKDEFVTDRVWIGISSDKDLEVHNVDDKTRVVLGVDEAG